MPLLLTAFALLAGLTLGAGGAYTALPTYQDPIQSLRELEDEPGRVYVWEVPSESKRRGFLKTLADYEDDVGGLQSAHFVLAEEEELHEYSENELERLA